MPWWVPAPPDVSLPVPPSGQRTRAGRLPPISQGGLLVSREPHPLIVRATAEVERGWAQALGDAFDPEETRGILDWLAGAIDLAANGLAPDKGQGASALGRFLLDRIGSVLLSLLASERSVDRDEVLRLLAGVDAVRRAIEPDWDRYFASQLSGPDGLNIVVEVAHDIRSPITSIRCLAETLERGQSGPVTDVQRKQLRLIYSAALSLSTMTTDVIEMARRFDQASDSELVPFSVGEAIEAVLDMVRPIAEEKGLVMRWSGPPADQRMGNPLALNRIILNLVTNALKFTDEGSVEVTARVSTPTRVEFSVRDSGRGISDEAMMTLFQPFRRSSARAGRSGYFFSGTGLGLAMVRKLLESLGSELQFETGAGTGTRFFFELDMPPVTRL